MADPVSWLMIEKGWKVVDRDGNDAGKIESVVGDTGRDIFDGLTIGKGLLAKPRYVPSERIASIVEGRVELDLSPAEVEALGEHNQPV
jgi:PRC-barrel domain